MENITKIFITKMHVFLRLILLILSQKHRIKQNCGVITNFKIGAMSKHMVRI